MTSIVTNFSSLAALQTLRSIHSQLSATQGQVSSGLSVATASDNAAYWSISTTMRSDSMAISAVSDALGLGAAKVEVAYAGLDAVLDALSEVKARLVAAEEDGVDKTKIQSGGMSARSAAARFGIGISTAIAWIASARQSQVSAAKQGRPGGSRLDDLQAFIVGMIEASKDITLNVITFKNRPHMHWSRSGQTS